jgi:predicted thioredoxin/glutaredoxin
MVIDVLGLPGAATSELETVLAQALESCGLTQDVIVRRVEDPGLMIARGVRKPPALVVDGRVVCRGRVPSVAEIRDCLDAART